MSNYTDTCNHNRKERRATQYYQWLLWNDFVIKAETRESIPAMYSVKYPDAGVIRYCSLTVLKQMEKSGLVRWSDGQWVRAK